MSLFGYYGLGMRALSAARLGLQVAGDNISNVQTPGYARRTLDLTPGLPISVRGGMLDQGVEVAGIRRIQDRFLQASLERESGSLSYSRQRLEGLREAESVYGTLDGENLLTAYGRFADGFASVASHPEDVAVRASALNSAQALADQLRNTYERLSTQQRNHNAAINDRVGEVNRLAQQLENLNRAIPGHEADGSVAAPLRDQRQLVVERLVQLTGGTAATAENGKVLFQFAGGPTLVSSERAIELKATFDPAGFSRLSVGTGADITDRFRQGEIGGLLAVRDDTITAKKTDLDSLAADLITRSNQLTTATFDLDGNPGIALYVPDPPGATGSARAINVNPALLSDPRRLAVSADGQPGDNLGAVEIAAIFERASGGLLWKSPAEFLSQSLTTLGNDIVHEDVNASVSGGLVESLGARRDAISNVSLDEEAIELIKHQRSFEAAARFISVLNDITEIAVNLGRR